MTTDRTVVERSVRHRAERIRRRQVRRALRRLETLGPVTDEQRAAVETLATSLVDRLLAPPEQQLQTAQPDEETVRALARLYG